MHHIAIFASGTGSNARKIIEYFKQRPEVTVSLVISNKQNAGVLEIAREHGVPTLHIRRDTFYGTESILDELAAHHIDFIVLAGFLWLVPAYLVRAFSRRIVNIHPALLPKYGGKGMYGHHVHEAVKAAGETETGITIHYVNEEYDEGAVIFQARCPVEPADTPDDIARKVHELEHRHFPEVIAGLLSGD
ncbi:MAG: phosphoribosylglycinamide formyltransferase [Bacteroidetes bacterium]|nr:MAG: phosphoribosylglycinamide formyltransferase [Bacteroidota bacterium]